MHSFIWSSLDAYFGGGRKMGTSAKISNKLGDALLSLN